MVVDRVYGSVRSRKPPTLEMDQLPNINGFRFYRRAIVSPKHHLVQANCPCGNVMLRALYAV